MSRECAVTSWLVLLVLALCCRHGDARVRLNSIRTVILREGHALPVNRSAWEPSLDLTLFQCMSDLECSEGSYCHAPSRGPSHSRCQTCRRRKRRCHRDAMCCPGNHCTNNICVADFVSHSIQDADGEKKKKGWRRRGKKANKMADKGAASKGQVGDPCLRSSDCSPSLCCARHFWTRICKPVLREGQVCTRHHRHKANHGLELFQRCPCGEGLGCRTLRDPGEKEKQKALEKEKEKTSPLSIMADASKSKFARSHSSSSLHSSLLSAPEKRSSDVSKARLHVCQKD